MHARYDDPAKLIASIIPDSRMTGADRLSPIQFSPPNSTQLDSKA